MGITLAIDLGSTNLKVGLVKQNRLLELKTAKLTTQSFAAGEAVHNMNSIKAQLFTLLKDVITLATEPVDNIVSTSYQMGMMLLDSNNKPLTQMTLLADTRAQNTFFDFGQTVDEEGLYHRTGCPLLSQYLFPRLFYFSREQPELFQKIGKIHVSKSWLFEWFTGEFVTDISTACATQLFNIEQMDWDADVLHQSGLQKGFLPRVKDGLNYSAPMRQELATQLGLRNNITVWLGVYDGGALAIGLSGLEPNTAVINLGTTAMFRVPASHPVFDKNENKLLQAYTLDQRLFFNGGALNNASLPLNWMQQELFAVDLNNGELLVQTQRSPLFCLPYLTGERDSKTGPFASGVFLGLRSGHTKTDLVRATLEGVAYSLYNIYDALTQNGGAINKIVVGGGGAKTLVWPQLIANVFGMPVQISTSDEPALMGSAALAEGKISDMDDSATSTVEPNLQTFEMHKKKRLFFNKIKDTNTGLFEELVREF